MKAQRFRKKQVEVEAVQWTGENVAEVGRLLRFTGQDIGAALARHGLGVLKGDYIIRDPDDFLSVLSEPTFLDRYEPVAPQPSSNEEKLREDWTRDVVAALLSINTHGALTENEAHMVQIAREALLKAPEELKQEITAGWARELEEAEEKALREETP